MTRTIRRIAQIAFLAGWVYIIWTTKYPLTGFVNPRVFFQLDPLVMLLTAVAERVWLPGLVFATTTLLLTWLFGRVFCGWFCPLGSVMDLTAAVTQRWRKYKEADPSRWQVLKYLILGGIALLALGGIQFVWFLDPLAIFVRFFSLNLHPFLNSGLDRTMAWLLNTTGSSLLEQWYEQFKDVLLDVSHPAFPHSAFILTFFLAILAAVLLQRRFWCRYLCPLGGLLGLIARWTPYRRVVHECKKDCGICRNVCRTNAIESNNAYRPQECVVCMDCTVGCPGQRTDFVFHLPSRRQPEPKPKTENGLTRAQFLTLLAGALVTTAAASRPGASDNLPRYLLRPPGALPEDEFVQRCVRCGNCMKACLTNVLQPTLLEGGLEGLWTPHLAPAISYCEYQCALCGQVCPTGAIRELPVEAKKQFRIGLAVINRNLCYPWAKGTQCLVCEEHCPVANKAIKIDYFTNSKGKRIGRPVVDANLCIGCAICEVKCPVKVEKAIRVRAL